MKSIYFECSMGAAGDMLTASLIELLPNPDDFIAKINGLGIPTVAVSRNSAKKCGISGTNFSVEINGEHEEHHHHNHHHHEEHTHNKMTDISALIKGLPVSEFVKEHALEIYGIIAEAEAKVHQMPVELIHFHEVGAMDAVCDIVAFCMLIEILGPDVIIASPVAVGSGFVHCAHGILPVPAPATAEILTGVPIYSGDIESELCTPTGAAILKHFVQKFVPMPISNIEKIGYGCGKKDFEKANCIRAYLGETFDKADDIVELCCNLDDMTAEALGFACDLILKKGALDVFTAPVFMKKNRPAVLLTVLAKTEDKDRITRLILEHTTTFGVRQKFCTRQILAVKKTQISTEYGEFTIKIGEKYGIKKYKPEFEDIAQASEKHGVSFDTIYKRVITAFEEEN